MEAGGAGFRRGVEMLRTVNGGKILIQRGKLTLLVSSDLV